MSDFFDLNTSLSLISVVFSISIFVFFLWKANRNGLLYSFLFFQSMIFFWPFASVYHKLLIMNGVNGRIYHFLGCQAMEFLAYCYTGAAWVIFCLYYKNVIIPGKKKIILLLMLVSTMFFVISMINRNRNDLTNVDLYKEHFYLTFFILLTYILVGIFILLRNLKKERKFFRKQTVSLILAILLPVIFIIYRVYLIKIGAVYLIYKQIYINVIPIGFTLSSFFISIACFKYQFMNIIPIALNKAIDSMQEGILIINLSGAILKYNQTFQTRFSKYLRNNNPTFETFLKNLNKDMLNKDKLNKDMLNKDMLNNSSNRENFELLQVMKNEKAVNTFEISIDGAPKQYYSVILEPIIIKNETVGQIISFHDITAYKSLLEELKQKNTSLEDANAQLIRFTEVMEELAASKERNRIARDVHDSVGHTLTSIIYLLEVCNITSNSDIELTRRKLEEVLGIARDGLLQVKTSVEGIMVQKVSEISLTDQIRQLISGFQHSDIEVKLSIIGQEFANISGLVKETVYRVCQEGLTNAIRHGKPKNIDILLKYENSLIRLYIIDDGEGCKKINKDYGLSGMETRIHRVNGVLQYGPGEERGFFIHAEIPIPQE